MENEELENIDSQNDELETLDSSNEEVELEEVEDTEEEEKEEYSEREKQLYARLKKAEADLKEKKVEKKDSPKTDSKLSIFDQKAIFNADIDTQEDLDEIMDYADRKNISVAEALKSTVIKATLAENAEIRNSANAVNTGTGKRASGTTTDAQLLANANNGKMPSSEADIAKLALMRFKKKE